MVSSELIVFICSVVGAFFVGAIPSGYLFAKWCGVYDVRAVGSGNIGASNVGRILGWKAFIAVFFLDAVKAALLLLYVQKWLCSMLQLTVVAFILLLGNCFSPFLRFNGGKGVATLIGILGVFSPIVMCGAVLVWLFVIAATHVPAIASLCTLCVLPFLSYAFISTSFIPFLLAASCIVIVRHKQNLQSMYI